MILIFKDKSKNMYVNTVVRYNIDKIKNKSINNKNGFFVIMWSTYYMLRVIFLSDMCLIFDLQAIQMYAMPSNVHH